MSIIKFVLMSFQSRVCQKMATARDLKYLFLDLLNHFDLKLRSNGEIVPVPSSTAK